MYIQRDYNGQIVGAFANLQPGFAEESIADDAPELVKFLLPPDTTLMDANAKRDDLLALAGLRVAPLQDAVDLGAATATDIANLKLWKQYRVDVNRVSGQAGFPTIVNWPQVPA